LSDRELVEAIKELIAKADDIVGRLDVVIDLLDREGVYTQEEIH
jgi:hypothetical protein